MLPRLRGSVRGEQPLDWVGGWARVFRGEKPPSNGGAMQGGLPLLPRVFRGEEPLPSAPLGKAVLAKEQYDEDRELLFNILSDNRPVGRLIAECPPCGGTRAIIVRWGSVNGAGGPRIHSNKMVFMFEAISKKFSVMREEENIKKRIGPGTAVFSVPEDRIAFTHHPPPPTTKSSQNKKKGFRSYLQKPEYSKFL